MMAELLALDALTLLCGLVLLFWIGFSLWRSSSWVSRSAMVARVSGVVVSVIAA